MNAETITRNVDAVARKLAFELLTDPKYADMLDELTCGGKYSRGKAAGFLALRLIAEHPELVL